MATREATYALARRVPYLLLAGEAQTISAPVRHGSDGGLIAPTSGTVTITKPDGTSLVSGAAVTVSSSTATYEVTPSASETLGEGWRVLWSLTIDGVVYNFRLDAYLCQYVPPNTVSVLDLYARMPELEGRIPQRQSDRGDGTGWQPQIDATYYELLQRMIDDGRRPWKVVGITGAHEWAVTRTVQRCVTAIPHGAESAFGQASKELAYEVQRLWSSMRLQYEDDSPTVRRGTSPTVRLASASRRTM